MIGNAGQHVGKPGTWIDVVQFCRDDERIPRRCPLAAAVAPGKQPGFPAKGHATQAALSRIVGQTNPPIVEKARESLPALEHIVHRFRHIGVTRELAALGSHPLLERRHKRRDSDLPDCVPLRQRKSDDLALNVEDRIDPAHRLDRQWCFGNIGEHKQLASGMAPACRFGNRAGFATGCIEIIEAGISISLQDPAIACKMSAWMLAGAIARVEEHGGRLRRTTERAIVTYVNPETTGDGLPPGEHRYRGVVAMDTFGSQHVTMDQGHQWRQRHGAGTHPICQREYAEIDALAGEPLALAVERLMLSEFGMHDRRQQVRARAATGDRMEWRRRLRDRLARAAGELLSHRLDHFVAARDALQRLGDRLAQFDELAATAWAACRSWQHDALAREICRERSAHRLGTREWTHV